MNLKLKRKTSLKIAKLHNLLYFLFSENLLLYTRFMRNLLHYEKQHHNAMSQIKIKQKTKKIKSKKGFLLRLFEDYILNNEV